MPEQLDIHHHEVQEVMGRMPGWVTRWASTGLLAIFLLLVFTAHFVRFPDQVPATVRLVTATGAAGQAPVVRVRVPIEQAAAVQPGQALQIDLRAYPAAQYGYLQATVQQVLPFSSPDSVEVRVALPAQWRTTMGLTLKPQPLLHGVGTITVSETSLLRRVLHY